MQPSDRDQVRYRRDSPRSWPVSRWRAAPPRSPSPPTPEHELPRGRSPSTPPTRACALSATEAGTGPSTFVITNNGTKVTEFYVYGEGDRVLGEVENISPGLQRKLIVQLSRAGHLPDRLQAGHDRRRHPRRLRRHRARRCRPTPTCKFKQAADDYKRYVNSQAEALVPATEAFVAAIKAGDVATAKAHVSRPRAPTTNASNRSPSRSPTTSTRASTCARRTWSRARSGPASTGWRRTCGSADCSPTAQRDRRPAGGRRQGTRRRGEVTGAGPSIATQIAGGAQGLLDEVAISKITGEEDIFSHTDLWDFNANLEGSRTAVASVRPILDERDAELGKRVDQRFADVEAIAGQVPQGRRVRASTTP